MADETLEQLEVGDGNVQEIEEQRHAVIVTLDGRDETIPMDNLGVSLESTPKEILDAVGAIIAESEGGTDGYEDAYGDFTYTVRKAMNSDTIYVYPKPVAG